MSNLRLHLSIRERENGELRAENECQWLANEELAWPMVDMAQRVVERGA